jgi:UDP-3-O-[3-hydroxymyristoyl] N-acetylglucosamine deacetylase
MAAYFQQNTISKPVNCSGVGVHSGKAVNLTVKPAPLHHGIQFVRKDLADCPQIAARFNQVVDTSLATVIGNNGFIVSTIEHLMAAFSGLSIDNALVEVDGYEMPIMDGSAAPFASILMNAGIESQPGPKCFFVIKRPIELREDDKFVGVYPASEFKITCTINYAHKLIGVQTLTKSINRDTFINEIAMARTFGFLGEYELLKQYGLAKGGSLENVVVIDKDEILNPDGLRFGDEFVRHKLLDCIGDFALLGMPIFGHLIVKKTGHAFNHRFLQKFFQQKECWETGTFYNASGHSPLAAKALAI